MVEIRYGEYSEQADLTGKSVAEAREQYKPKFDIPDRARAKLNDKEVKPKLEPEAKLNDGDKLSFDEKSRRGLVLLGAFLLTLAVTGGLFAYTYITTTATLGLTPKGDFVSVTDNSSATTWSVWGNYKGKMTPGDLFTITPGTDFTADMTCIIVLANAYDLVDAYRVLVFEIEIYDDGGTGSKVGTTEYLTLSKGEISIEIAQTTPPYQVKLINGFYITHRAGWGSDKEDPILLCDIIQRGT